ncbi:hypothetical protein BH11PSE12_BH11PSE12_00530 [soil metagenome]
MKKVILAVSLALASIAVSIPASAYTTDVGVSINFAQPGMYGRIDIGNVPGPQLIYSQPVIIMAPARGVIREPLYLYVPPGHQKKWSKHCAAYNACGQPVYFVQEGWYRNVYVPRYREYEGRRDRHEGKDDYRRDDEQGHGKDKNKDKHKDKDNGNGKHHGKDD